MSLTCVLCKICEKIIRKKLVEHLESNNLITDKQHGFRNKRSTLSNLLVYMEMLTSALDNQIPVDVNYLDFKKAFDTVPHKRLLAKLHDFGIRGLVLKWIEDFLSDRKMFVKIRNASSDHMNVTSRVPQGSVLGPVLFIVFINDLVNEMECPMLLFADDAKVFVKINTDEDIQALTRDMKRLEEWSQRWLLKFNAEKCVTMHLGSRNPRADYELDGGNSKEV